MSWILIAVLLVMMVKCNYPLIVLIDLLQYIHLHIYILVNPIPYLFMTVLQVFKNINLSKSHFHLVCRLVDTLPYEIICSHTDERPAL